MGTSYPSYLMLSYYQFLQLSHSLRIHQLQSQLTQTPVDRPHTQQMVDEHVAILQKMARSLMSLACELCRRPLCCSDASQVGAQRGRAWTHLVNVLSAMPCPCIIPPDVFSVRIKNCSMVWSEKLPPQNASCRQIVKYPFSVNSLYSSLGMRLSRDSICCKIIQPCRFLHNEDVQQHGNEESFALRSKGGFPSYQSVQLW